MKHLAALFTVTLLPALATAQDDPDVEVYRDVATQAPIPAGVAVFDADWTAEQTIAMAFVEDHGESDKLIVATHDPAQSGPEAFVKLGEYQMPPWKIIDVSLAVPEYRYGTPEMDRVFVAVTFQAVVPGSLNPWGGYEVVNAARLFSVSLDPRYAKLQMTLPKNVPVLTSFSVAQPPNAQVVVLPQGNDYVVEVAFLDPNSQANGNNPFNGVDNQVMMMRSFDHGDSLENAFFVTGLRAINAATLGASMGHGQYGRVALAADESFGGTILAIEDMYGDVVHVLTTNPGQDFADWYASTPQGDYRKEFAPRIASAESSFNLVCLAGRPTRNGGHALVWFAGQLGGGTGALVEHQQLHHDAATEGDIDVRGGKAWIIARCYPDNGGAALPTAFEDQRHDPWRVLTPVLVADGSDAAGTPRVGSSPEGTPRNGSYFFGREGGGTLLEGVWMDP